MAWHVLTLRTEDTSSKHEQSPQTTDKAGSLAGSEKILIIKIQHFIHCYKGVHTWMDPDILFHVVAQLVEALFYKPEGRGFDSRSGHWIFQLT
jgi:hypothetical protein